MTRDQHFDLVVVGSGPAGEKGAAQAALQVLEEGGDRTAAVAAAASLLTCVLWPSRFVAANWRSICKCS